VSPRNSLPALGENGAPITDAGAYFMLADDSRSMCGIHSSHQSVPRAMKILLVNQAFHPDVVSSGQHLTDLALALAERGHAVTVLTGRRAYDSPTTLFPREEIWRGIRICRIASTGFGKSAKWRRAADFASFSLLCLFKLAIIGRHDVVVALTSPPLVAFLAACVTGLRGGRFFYWVMDFNPDEAIAAGWLREGSLAASVLGAMSGFSLRRAAKIIALDRFMRDRIVAKGIAPEKLLVLPPWSHDSDVRFDPDGRARFRAAHGLAGKFVVMYSGNHSPVHPLDTLMRAAERLKGDASIAFCFIGGGSEFKRVKAWTEAGQRTNVLCLPYQPLNQLAASLSAADAHVVVMGASMLGLVHPCKIYNILAVGAPVIYIGPKPSHVTEILENLGSGYPSIQVSHGESDSLVDQIQDLQRRGKDARGQLPAAATAPYSKDVLLPALVEDLEEPHKLHVIRPARIS
jgi:glycosyltransferase involved in cell wall biosynthesis